MTIAAFLLGLTVFQVSGGGLAKLTDDDRRQLQSGNTMGFDADDMAQYNQWLAGITTTDMDAEELKRYAAFAKEQGVTPGNNQNGGAEGSMSPMTYGWSGEDWKQFNMYKAGIITADMDAEELQRYKAYAAAQGITVETTSTPAAGASSSGSASTAPLHPNMMFDNEDRAQYQQYKAGIVSPDMDAEELARYAALARAEGVPSATPTGRRLLADFGWSGAEQQEVEEIPYSMMYSMYKPYNPNSFNPSMPYYPSYYYPSMPYYPYNGGYPSMPFYNFNGQDNEVIFQNFPSSRVKDNTRRPPAYYPNMPYIYDDENLDDVYGQDADTYRAAWNTRQMNSQAQGHPASHPSPAPTAEPYGLEFRRQMFVEVDEQHEEEEDEQGEPLVLVEDNDVLVKSGFSNDDAPRHVFPSITSLSKDDAAPYAFPSSVMHTDEGRSDFIGQVHDGEKNSAAQNAQSWFQKMTGSGKQRRKL